MIIGQGRRDIGSSLKSHDDTMLTIAVLFKKFQKYKKFNGCRAILVQGSGLMVQGSGQTKAEGRGRRDEG